MCEKCTFWVYTEQKKRMGRKNGLFATLAGWLATLQRAFKLAFLKSRLKGSMHTYTLSKNEKMVRATKPGNWQVFAAEGRIEQKACIFSALASLHMANMASRMSTTVTNPNEAVAQCRTKYAKCIERVCEHKAKRDGVVRRSASGNLCVQCLIERIKTQKAA